MSMREIIFAGFGGQGVLTVGMLTAKIGVAAGKQVTWIPSYGSEMRGGTANCSVKISDEEIASPFVKSPVVLIALNEPSLHKFMGSMKPGGVLIANTSIIGEDVQYRDDVTVIKVDADGICRKNENMRGVNLVMLGAMAGAVDLFDEALYIDGIADYFKKYPQMHDRNVAVFQEGWAQGASVAAKAQ